MREFQVIHVEKGAADEEKKLLSWLSRYILRLPDGDYEVWLTPTNKTKAQNDYYNCQIRNMCEELCLNEEEIRNYAKQEFLPKDEYIVLITTKQPQTTRGLKKDYMSDFITKVREWSRDFLNYYWRDPEEYKHLN